MTACSEAGSDPANADLLVAGAVAAEATDPMRAGTPQLAAVSPRRKARITLFVRIDVAPFRE
jgi:hypothetical protein